MAETEHRLGDGCARGIARSSAPPVRRGREDLSVTLRRAGALSFHPHATLVSQRPRRHRRALCGFARALCRRACDVSLIREPLNRAVRLGIEQAERIRELTGLQGTLRDTEHTQNAFVRDTRRIEADFTGRNRTLALAHDNSCNVTADEYAHRP